ncbi:hypothetical protein AYI69_g442, partial [Smittium culicis]
MCVENTGEVLNLKGSIDSSVPLYDTENFISIPCDSISFEFSFEVVKTSDIYFLVTNSRGAYQDIGLSGQVGFISGDYGLGDAVFQNSNAESQDDTAIVTIKSSITQVSMYIDDILFGSIDSEDSEYPEFLSSGSKQLYFAADISGTSILNIKVLCMSKL